MTADIVHEADLDAVERVLASRPTWSALKRAGDAVALERDVLLHAGPAFPDPRSVTRPVLNSACVAAVFEGLAADLDEAEAMIARGAVRLAPAQDRNVVTPLAAVVSSSMWLQEVADRSGRHPAWSPFNGGNGPVPRLGLRSVEVLERVRWLNDELALVLGRRMDEPVDLLAIARHALARGDDLHGRTPEATARLAEIVDGGLGRDAAAERARDFLAASPGFFLNLWMAACKSMLGAARGIAGSSLVITAGANGAATGIAVAGLPDRWFTAAAEPPRGSFDVDLPADRALGAIGDSAIVDAMGFGAMSMRHAPAQQKALLPFMPADGLSLPDRLLAAAHPAFAPLTIPVGLTARAVAAAGEAPVVSLGIVDRMGEAGRLGGGIFRQPLALFQDALAALDGAPATSAPRQT
jgi:hypothetical protein